ncbi:translocation protein TolB precursor [Parvularcula bermudensis HTCC2503]|uniref:Tol-Pal system protein TolB n=1 Tax=Parvularcula bermudensis (strain ATCC BAA-594 / HTCC2503 / KCTC 12087) TaxID=314260 RepID=E0TDI8_PARBH|nr:Tol-Pal system beta propeller repeat protein TolB [Parvularcula bermudensis]ADM08743.1 translocation protein TolB precursor [Parvularcula bermudensis HTCC2503]
MVLIVRVLSALFVAFTLALPLGAVAQDEPLIDIVGGRTDPMPVALPAFIATGEGAERVSADLSEVIRDDLASSSLFAPIDPAAFIQQLQSVNTPPRFADWRAIDARVLLVGEVTALSGGRIQVAARLWDVGASKQLGTIAFKTPATNVRKAGHEIADFVYEQLTGEPGYFDTKIVYVAESGPKTDRRKRLMIMDQDGANPSILTDGLNFDALTPRFSPTQQQIIFLAMFDDRPSQVYLYDIETTEMEALGSWRGMTFAPRFSTDGRGVLLSIEEAGNTDIARMDLITRRIERLTRNPAIDTSPSMSPDGRHITFASDRGGSQQIYVMNADGSDQRRITFGNGTYGTPVWSPRGDLIAFTRLYRGRFYIGVVKPDGTGERLLTESYLDEGPTWSPNGRVIMFFRENRPGGPVNLYSIDLTGRNLRRVETSTEASDPAWSPLLD